MSWVKNSIVYKTLKRQLVKQSPKNMLSTIKKIIKIGIAISLQLYFKMVVVKGVFVVRIFKFVYKQKIKRGVSHFIFSVSLVFSALPIMDILSET